MAGKRIVLSDESIVRGTTSLKIVQMMRDAGAAEVHMRIASPPTQHSCFYGVDTPERAKLLAAQMTVGQMANLINADSLSLISIAGRSEEQTYAVHYLMPISYAVFCLTKTKHRAN